MRHRRRQDQGTAHPRHPRRRLRGIPDTGAASGAVRVAAVPGDGGCCQHHQEEQGERRRGGLRHAVPRAQGDPGRHLSCFPGGWSRF